MFTQDQINQLQQLFESNNEKIRKTVREEIEVEAEKTRVQHQLDWLALSNEIDSLRDEFKDMKIGIMRLEKVQVELRNDLTRVAEIVISHSKTLNYLKNKLNYTAKTVDIIGRSYNNEIVENKIRTDRIEKRLGISQH